MKTPEEIRYGLLYHGDTICDKRCAYHVWGGTGYDCSSMLCQDAYAYIQQLEAQIPRWIPVEDRLPEENSVVLIYWVYHFFEATYLGDGNFRMLGGQVISAIPANSTFTHWMPLPEPPTEEE